MGKKKNIYSVTAAIIAISMIASICMMFGYKKIVTPKYTSTSQLIVNKVDDENKTRLTDMQADIQMIATYSDVIKSPYILNKVSNQLKTEKNIAQIQSKITVNSNKDSQVFSINVTDKTPQKAQLLNQILTNVFYTNASQILKIKNITILSAANLPQSSVGVTQFQFVIATFVVVFFFLAIIAITYFYLKKKGSKSNGE